MHQAPSGAWGLWVRLEDDTPPGRWPGLRFPPGPGPTVEQRTAALASLGFTPVHSPQHLALHGWAWKEINAGTTGGITLLGQTPVRSLTLSADRD
ncbi:DUF6303 family protein [Streptomyces sp. NPDC019396]|uniref:DUF6303 family protein n=1 Tax=Streptomyces sp. NPDC019396 TaxID=3154687 RepID=UPI0033E7E451